MNMNTANNIMWEYYWPALIDQYTGPSIFDTDAEREFKAKMRTKLESLSREQAQEWLKALSEQERRDEYERLKEEFGDA